jgi:predicted alpha/beta-fold hydrolase
MRCCAGPQEAGDSAAAVASAVVAVSSPVDLAAGGHAIGRGFNRLVYTRMFLRSMKPKALAKLAQHPGLFSRERCWPRATCTSSTTCSPRRCTAFRDTDDYWAARSAKPHLHRIRVPALVLNARNDPFVPAASACRAGRGGPLGQLWQPAHGGHVGFPAGAFRAMCHCRGRGRLAEPHR